MRLFSLIVSDRSSISSIHLLPASLVDDRSYPVGVDRRQQAEEQVGAEWAEWYFLTPEERWSESCRMWETYLALGGTLEPEPDSQSPFFDADEWRSLSADGRPGVRVLRRGGV